MASRSGYLDAPAVAETDQRGAVGGDVVVDREAAQAGCFDVDRGGRDVRQRSAQAGRLDQWRGSDDVRALGCPWHRVAADATDRLGDGQVAATSLRGQVHVPVSVAGSGEAGDPVGTIVPQPVRGVVELRVVAVGDLGRVDGEGHRGAVTRFLAPVVESSVCAVVGDGVEPPLVPVAAGGEGLLHRDRAGREDQCVGTGIEHPAGYPAQVPDVVDGVGVGTADRAVAGEGRAVEAVRVADPVDESGEPVGIQFGEAVGAVPAHGVAGDDLLTGVDVVGGFSVVESVEDVSFRWSGVPAGRAAAEWSDQDPVVALAELLLHARFCERGSHGVAVAVQYQLQAVRAGLVRQVDGEWLVCTEEVEGLTDRRRLLARYALVGHAFAAAECVVRFVHPLVQARSDGGDAGHG